MFASRVQLIVIVDSPGGGGGAGRVVNMCAVHSEFVSVVSLS